MDLLDTLYIIQCLFCSSCYHPRTEPGIGTTYFILTMFLIKTKFGKMQWLYWLAGQFVYIGWYGYLLLTKTKGIQIHSYALNILSFLAQQGVEMTHSSILSLRTQRT